MRGYYAYGTHMNFPKFEYLRDGMAPVCVMFLSYVLFLECAAGYVCTKYPLAVRRDRTCQRFAWIQMDCGSIYWFLSLQLCITISFYDKLINLEILINYYIIFRDYWIFYLILLICNEMPKKKEREKERERDV